MDGGNNDDVIHNLHAHRNRHYLTYTKIKYKKSLNVDLYHRELKSTWNLRNFSKMGVEMVSPVEIDERAKNVVPDRPLSASNFDLFKLLFLTRLSHWILIGLILIILSQSSWPFIYFKVNKVYLQKYIQLKLITHTLWSKLGARKRSAQVDKFIRHS